jgi:hypothetical protein
MRRAPTDRRALRASVEPARWTTRAAPGSAVRARAPKECGGAPSRPAPSLVVARPPRRELPAAMSAAVPVSARHVPSRATAGRLRQRARRPMVALAFGTFRPGASPTPARRPTWGAHAHPTSSDCPTGTACLVGSQAVLPDGIRLLYVDVRARPGQGVSSFGAVCRRGMSASTARAGKARLPTLAAGARMASGTGQRAARSRRLARRGGPSATPSVRAPLARS